LTCSTTAHDVCDARKLLFDTNDADDADNNDPNTLDTEGLLTIDPDEETPKPKPPTAKRVRRTRKSAVVATAHLDAPAPVDPAFTISALALSSTASSPTIDSLGADTDDFDLLSIPPGFDQAMLEMTSDSGLFGFGDPWTEEDE
jgi:hypothetical protein